MQYEADPVVKRLWNLTMLPWVPQDSQAAWQPHQCQCTGFDMRRDKETVRLQQVLTHPQFKADPIAAVSPAAGHRLWQYAVAKPHQKDDMDQELEQ